MAPKPKPNTKTETKRAGAFMRAMSALNTWIYRVTKGRLAGTFPGGAPILLLTTIGRKSGKARTTPLLFLASGEDLVIVASKAGMDEHPLWYMNLTANPDVETQVKGRVEKRRARTASQEEKAQLWPRLVELYPPYKSYQERTEREIPVVILSHV